MFKKILLPIDLTDKYGQALDVAADLSGSSSEITLLHVIETIAGLTMDEEKDFYRRLEKSARRHLDKVGAQLTSRKVAWQMEVLYGNREAEVVRYARAAETTLIIMTSPQFDPNNIAASLGSLSYKISLFSPCPVLLVK